MISNSVTLTFSAPMALPKIFSSSWEYGGITIALGTYTLLEDEIRSPMFITTDPLPHS